MSSKTTNRLSLLTWSCPRLGVLPAQGEFQDPNLPNGPSGSSSRRERGVPRDKRRRGDPDECGIYAAPPPASRCADLRSSDRKTRLRARRCPGGPALVGSRLWVLLSS